MSAIQSFTTRTGSRVSIRLRAARGLSDLGCAAAIAWRAMTTRRHLLEMDDRMLSDLGVSRAQANFEATRPIWRIRSTRR